MKTITVLTLVFLPSTLVTVKFLKPNPTIEMCGHFADMEQSIWSADLFQLDASVNWKVYLGVTLALTAGVFTAWFLYLRYSSLRRKERLLHIAGVGYIRDGEVVGTGPSGREGTSFDLRREAYWQDT